MDVYVIEAELNGKKVYYNSFNLYWTELKSQATKYRGQKPLLMNFNWIKEDYKNIEYIKI